ncbi:hypothetical protein [Paenibacillus sepulcri]
MNLDQLSEKLMSSKSTMSVTAEGETGIGEPGAGPGRPQAVKSSR